MTLGLTTAQEPAPAPDRGATAVEYALLASLIAGVIIAVVGFLGQDVTALFTSVDWTP
ncbi:Flp family type IVb pilin [Nocardioides caeni]|uniref:Flp family type IVb pilin n=1 Tax=Nocardioides caeni TaxID=574700 RepID=A0A4S8NQ27_9ACTN|nr:Flp family type IVb pilin [Nocardioides caeni]THV18501.1 Flp family type IVb pilin [Nocardioides caeni]